MYKIFITFILAMKWSVVFVLLATVQVGATSVSRGQEVSIRLENADLKELFRELQKQTGYDFLYVSKDLEGASLVNLHVEKQPLNLVLDAALTQQPVTYEIENKAVLITRRQSVGQPIVQEPIPVFGRITDTTGRAVPGVTVSVKGTNVSTVANEEGYYNVTTPSPGSTLIFTSLGYVSQEHTVTGQTKILNVVLKIQFRQLDDAIVIGYGTVSKEDLTGSVAQVNMDDLAQAPVGSFDEALAGRIAGVQVSSADGQPGGTMDITIRGPNSLTQSNAPLYVIDGFPLEDLDNASINPEEIESINILKDASATAIYGSRGANGVIIIETKKGMEGKPVISLSSSLGYQQEQKQMDMMTPYEFLQYQLEVNETLAKQTYMRAELDPAIDTLYDPMGRTLEDYRNMGGINWQDLLFQNAPIQRHSLAIRGGNEATKYSLSGSYFDQQGIVLNTGSKRYQGRMTLDQSISPKLRTGITASYSQNVRYGQVVNDGGGANFTSYLLFRAWAYRPIAGDPSVDLVELEEDPADDNASDVRINPITSSINDHTYRYSSSLLANGYIEYDILKNLQLKMIGSVRSYRARNDRFYNSKTPQGSPRNRSHSRGVHGLFNYNEGNSWSSENTLTYTKRIQRHHNLQLMAGLSLQDAKNELFGYGVQQLPNESLGMYGLDEGIPYQSSASGGDYGLVSYFGRINYDYQSKYLLTATFRADASSKFHPHNRWGYFPSAAFAWNMKRESFLKNVRVVTTSKLRLTYGVTGNNRIGNYEYYSNLALPLGASYSFNNATPTQGIIMSKLGNPDLRWESTEQFDIGYDLGLWKNRVELTFDYYRKTTKDLLLNADMPIATGFSRAFQNIGSIRNSGIEFALRTVNVRNSSFGWVSDFNISFNRNKVLALARNQESMFSLARVGQNTSPLYQSRVGYPAGMFFGFIFDGIYQYEQFDNPAEGTYVLKNELPDNGNPREMIQPGDIRYKDMNGDHIIDNNDMTMIGRGQPIHIGGFNNTLRYKDVSLNVLLQWSYGNQIYNANRLMFDGNYVNMPFVNQYAEVANRWAPDNPSNERYRVGGHGPAGYQSTRVLEDGSYLRLKTVSLTYSLPKHLIRPLLLNALNVRVSAQNLLTFTNYSGMDPETSVMNTVLTPGFDYAAYPQARTIMFGLNATF